MALHSEHYFQLMDQIGGVNERSLETFFYWNNPFALKHWTMNVIELLLIGGAIWAFAHAIQVLKKKSDPSNLCLCIAAIVYLLVCEVPLYFPQLIGAEPILVFAHNEFSAGMLYNMTPFYIVALYPALLYPSYVLVQNSGLFEQRFGLISGAICVGVIHSCFYEIFDHYGPQYGWWVWNYSHPHVAERLASVPLTSLVVFSLTPPMVATLLARFFFVRHVAKKQSQHKPVSVIGMALRTVLVGVLIPVLNALLPTAWITSLQFDVSVVRIVYFVTIAAAFAFAATVFVRIKADTSAQTTTTETTVAATYPIAYFVIFLISFIMLWVYALPEYLAASNGVTARGTPVGSLPYSIACFVFGGLFTYKSFALQAQQKLRLATA